MARLVIKTAKGPLELKPSEKSVNICMCGLSKNQPFCDGSHKATLDEKDDELYEYDKKGKRVECAEGEEDGECCGGGCCGGKDHDK
ncbi:MAG: CDGSH iron-sulfur domain-containing protein [Candidatus Roizmanbacteria bacterium]|nr:CDGSH iron-sulfur domain-containing protein [Candidatus Roizmanbacteria bacterium]